MYHKRHFFTTDVFLKQWFPPSPLLSVVLTFCCGADISIFITENCPMHYNACDKRQFKNYWVLRDSPGLPDSSGCKTDVVSSENSWQNICQAFLPWQKYCQWCWHFVVVETYPSSGNDNCGKWLQVILGNTMPRIRGNLSAIAAPRLKCSNARQNHRRPLLSPPITDGLVSLLRNCLASVYFSNVYLFL